MRQYTIIEPLILIILIFLRDNSRNNYFVYFAQFIVIIIIDNFCLFLGRKPRILFNLFLFRYLVLPFTKAVIILSIMYTCTLCTIAHQSGGKVAPFISNQWEWLVAQWQTR